MGVITNPCPDLSTVSVHHLVLQKVLLDLWFWFHGDVIKWKHFSHHRPLWGEPLVTGGFPLQRPVMCSFDVFFDLALNKRLSKQSRRHHAHCDITVNVFAWQEHFCQGMNYWSTLQPKMHGDCLSTDIQIYLHSSTILICCSSLIH